MNQLGTTTAENINRKHAECMHRDGELREIILEKVNKARECGVFLNAAKDTMRHGQWGPWVRENLVFTDRMAQIYMKFADAHPKPISELAVGVDCVTDAFRASGALSLPSRESGGTRAKNTPFDRLMLTFGNVRNMLNGGVDKDKINTEIMFDSIECEAQAIITDVRAARRKYAVGVIDV